jgi:hypothetical protein
MLTICCVQARDTGQRLEKNLQEAEQGVEKARTRFDSSAEDLERLLLIKSGESTKSGEMQGAVGGTSGKRSLGKAMGKTGLLFNKKNPQQMLRQEEEIRVKTSNASDAFRKEVHQTQQMRQEYFNLQLPRILRSLKESAEEIDNGTQYHLSRYAFLFESLVLGDGMAISPMGNTPDVSQGLKGNVEIIDNRADFKVYMQNYQLVHGRDYRGPKREGAYDDGFVSVTQGHRACQFPLTSLTLVSRRSRRVLERLRRRWLQRHRAYDPSLDWTSQHKWRGMASTCRQSYRNVRLLSKRWGSRAWAFIDYQGRLQKCSGSSKSSIRTGHR